MTDDLVKKLRAVDVSWTHEGELCAWAADHIEQLQKNEKKYQDIISKLIAKKVADEYWEKILHSQSGVDPWSILKENE
jgi:hypothetical protein